MHIFVMYNERSKKSTECLPAKKVKDLCQPSPSLCQPSGISICQHGGRPRFLAAPLLTLNLPLIASKETLERVKKIF